MNFIFISPNFPRTYWQFCDRLLQNGVNVLGIGDAAYDGLEAELKSSLTEYYKVGSLEDYEQVYRAVAFFAFKYGKIDWIESLNEKGRERFTEIIFGELDSFKTQDITTFFKTLLLQISPAWKAYRGLDKEDKKVVNRVVKRLFKSFLMKPEFKKLPMKESA